MTKRIRVAIIGANPDRGWAAQAHTIEKAAATGQRQTPG
jgi:hypothetical protein